MWGRAARIRHGLDGAEEIFAGRTGHKPAEALEVFILLVLVAGPAVQIRAAIVALPDFDDGIANRLTARIEDAPAHVGHFTHGRREAVIDDEQVVVGVERQVIGIEWPFGLARRAHQFLGQDAGDGEEGGSEAHLLHETTAVKYVWHKRGLDLVS